MDSLEEKAFYDILKKLAVKYDFTYPEDKLVALSKAVREVVDDKAKYTDWSERDDIKAGLKVGLILVLAEYGYPPVDRDEVYKEIFEQAENFKKYQAVEKVKSKTKEPIVIGGRTLHTVGEVSLMLGAVRVADISIRLDQEYKQDTTGLLYANGFAELKKLGVVSLEIVDSYFIAESIIAGYLSDFSEDMSEFGLKQYVCLDRARSGSVDILFGIFIVGSFALRFLEKYPAYADGFERMKKDLSKRWKKEKENNKNMPSMIDAKVQFKHKGNSTIH